MSEKSYDKCVRIRERINGENYYITIGDDFVHFTVPRENDPNMSRERMSLEKIAELINKVRGRHDSGITSRDL